MEAGMPYRDSRTSTPQVITPEFYGAHNLAPIESAAKPLFYLWKDMGKIAPDIELNEDMGNIDEILEIVMREIPPWFRP